jgi:uncharacterized protein (TIGR03089 family)
MRELTVSGAVLDPLFASNPVAPLITYYDDATGERIELSTATLSNWAAKTGNLLRDELGAGAGTRVGLALPAHWQTVGVLFGIWYIGAEVVLGRSECDIACCTADRLDEADAAVVPGGEVVALSLDAFGKPVEGLPFGITDYATAVRVPADGITPEPNPGAALAGRSVADVLSAARAQAASRSWTDADRVLSSASWDTAEAIIDNMLAVFVAGASLVQVAHPDPEKLARRVQTEKVTTEL